LTADLIAAPSKRSADPRMTLAGTHFCPQFIEGYRIDQHAFSYQGSNSFLFLFITASARFWVRTLPTFTLFRHFLVPFLKIKYRFCHSRESGNPLKIRDLCKASIIKSYITFLETALGVFILVILFFMYTNIKSDKTKTQMDSLITSLDRKGTELKLFINQEFSVDVERAIAEVEKLPGNLIKIIYYFSPRQTGK